MMEEPVAKPASDGLVRCHDDVYGSPMHTAYHDIYWGTPTRNEQRLFEFLSLSGMQAGLSWWGIWRRRCAFRAAFDDFDPLVVARYGEEKVAELLGDAGIIRNRAKIRCIIGNAQAVCGLRPEFEGLADYLWSFVGGKPRMNRWPRNIQVPAVAPPAEELSADMKRRGFRFCGPTIVYAYIQSVGLVNDHRDGCFKQAALPFDYSR